MEMLQKKNDKIVKKEKVKNATLFFCRELRKFRQVLLRSETVPWNKRTDEIYQRQF